MRIVLKWLLGLLFVAAGVNHFVMPDTYVRIMPPYLPWHLELVYISGVAEVLLGMLLLVPPFQRTAASWLMVLLIAVFPANVHMAVNAHLFPAIPPAALWLRLPLQGVLLFWAWWFTRPGADGEWFQQGVGNRK